MVSPEALLDHGMDVAVKKQLADVVLNAAKSKAQPMPMCALAGTCDSSLPPAKKTWKASPIPNRMALAISVIANGSWGFAATDNMDTDSIKRATDTAVAMAKVNAKLQDEPVQLAPQKGYGEVSWKTPIEKNAFEVPVKDKVDLLLTANDIALTNGASLHQ